MALDRIKSKRCALVAAAAMTAFTAAFIFVGPACAFATQYGHAEDGSATYDSVNDAWKAATDGKTVVMDCDWTVKSALGIDEGKSVTLKMNNHSITRTSANGDYNGSVIAMDRRASLNLIGDEASNHSFTYKGYNTDGKQSQQTITSGGLITGGSSRDRAGGIDAVDYTNITLTNVAVAGNKSEGAYGGGVSMPSECHLTLNNSKIEHNAAFSRGSINPCGSGGGIGVCDDNTTITLNGSSVSNNYAESDGGGIASNDSDTKIELNDKSKIDGNRADCSGGGIWFNYSYFSVLGDRTSSISNNVSGASGGGIYIERRYMGANKGDIDKVIISGNTSIDGTYGGGGILCRQENVYISYCIITNNKANRGGGIFIENDDNTVADCTITGNVCTTNAEAGGGIFMNSNVDLKIGGLLIVKDNKYVKGDTETACDVQLSYNDMFFYWQRTYLIGTVYKGSSIGLNTADTSRNYCMIKGLNQYYEGTFFLNKSSDAHMTYHDNELWRDKGEYKYLVTFDGEGNERYASGTSVVMNANLWSNKTFYRWNMEETTGLSPIWSCIPDPSNPIVNFAMPQNDVHFKATYRENVTYGHIVCGSPSEGQAFPTTANFIRKDGTDSAHTGSVSSTVTWYEVSDDGTKTAVAGKAKPGTTYVAAITVPQDKEKNIVFSEDTTGLGVSIQMGIEDAAKIDSVSVDKVTGAMTAWTTAVKTGGVKQDSADSQKTVTVNFADTGILSDGSSVAEALGSITASGKEDDSVASASSTQVLVDASGSSVITAPVREGYNFNHWENVPEGAVQDDEAGTVTFSDPADGIELTAVYTPKATEVDLGMDAPTAGKALASTIGSLKATCSDGETVDLKNGFSPKKDLDVTWSPQVTDGKADYRTSYTATIALDDADGYVGVEDVLADGTVVKLGGVELDGAVASFAIQDGKLCLIVSFPTTGDPVAQSVLQPQSAQVSYETASELTSSGSSSTSAWGLPKATTVTTVNGETVSVDIDWQVPSGFDAGIASAQTITAKGTLEEHSWLDTAGISTQVTAQIKVAAPADKVAAKAVKGKTVKVKANKATKKTKKAKSVKIKAPASSAGTVAKFKTISKSKLVKVKNGKVTLKKGAKKGKTYKAKVKVSYGKFSKTVIVKFKVK